MLVGIFIEVTSQIHHVGNPRVQVLAYDSSYRGAMFLLESTVINLMSHCYLSNPNAVNVVKELSYNSAQCSTQWVLTLLCSYGFLSVL